MFVRINIFLDEPICNCGDGSINWYIEQGNIRIYCKKCKAKKDIHHKNKSVKANIDVNEPDMDGTYMDTMVNRYLKKVEEQIESPKDRKKESGSQQGGTT